METNTKPSAIKAFISNLADQNYKSANDSLQKMIEIKLKERIQDAALQKNNN